MIDPKTATRAELTEYLEGRGFAVYAFECDASLRRATELDLKTRLEISSRAGQIGHVQDCACDDKGRDPGCRGTDD